MTTHHAVVDRKKKDKAEDIGIEDIIKKIRHLKAFLLARMNPTELFTTYFINLINTL